MQDIRKFKVCVNTMVNTFYVHNLMTHLAKTEPSRRPPQAVELFRTELEEYGKKMLEAYTDALFSYLVIAIAGEVRNLDTRTFKIPKSPAKTRRVIEKLVETGVHFERNDERGPTQKEVLQNLLSADTEETTDFLNAALEAFKHWNGSSAFGGRPWKVITRTVLRYAEGKLDRLQFLDTVFTLQHNGGELFDKHPSFDTHTKDSVLQNQLDVQAKAKNITQLIMGLTDLHKKFDEGFVELIRRGAAMQYWKRELIEYCAEQSAIRKGTKPSGKKKGGSHE